MLARVTAEDRWSASLMADSIWKERLAGDMDVPCPTNTECTPKYDILAPGSIPKWAFNHAGWFSVLVFVTINNNGDLFKCDVCDVFMTEVCINNLN